MGFSPWKENSEVTIMLSYSVKQYAGFCYFLKNLKLHRKKRVTTQHRIMLQLPFFRSHWAHSHAFVTTYWISGVTNYTSYLNTWYLPEDTLLSQNNQQVLWFFQLYWISQHTHALLFRARPIWDFWGQYRYRYERVRKFWYLIHQPIFYIKYFKCVWQRYVMEAGYLTNFIPNISALNSKHFSYYQLNNGPPSTGQTTWLHHFKLLVQAFFQP